MRKPKQTKEQRETLAKFTNHKFEMEESGYLHWTLDGYFTPYGGTQFLILSIYEDGQLHLNGGDIGLNPNITLEAAQDAIKKYDVNTITHNKRGYKKFCSIVNGEKKFYSKFDIKENLKSLNTKFKAKWKKHKEFKFFPYYTLALSDYKYLRFYPLTNEYSFDARRSYCSEREALTWLKLQSVKISNFK